MWVVKKLTHTPIGLIGEAIRLANESKKAGRYLVKQWRGLVLATQNSGGKSLSARLVRSGHLQCWQVVWVFKEVDGKRKWLFYFLFDPDRKEIWIGRPHDQEQVLKNVLGDQLSLF